MRNYKFFNTAQKTENEKNEGQEQLNYEEKQDLSLSVLGTFQGTLTPEEELELEMEDEMEFEIEEEAELEQEKDIVTQIAEIVNEIQNLVASFELPKPIVRSPEEELDYRIERLKSPPSSKPPVRTDNIEHLFDSARLKPGH